MLAFLISGLGLVLSSISCSSNNKSSTTTNISGLAVKCLSILDLFVVVCLSASQCT